jgi:hypothetical protein
LPLVRVDDDRVVVDLPGHSAHGVSIQPWKLSRPAYRALATFARTVPTLRAIAAMQTHLRVGHAWARLGRRQGRDTEEQQKGKQ